MKVDMPLNKETDQPNQTKDNLNSKKCGENFVKIKLLHVVLMITMYWLMLISKSWDWKIVSYECFKLMGCLLWKSAFKILAFYLGLKTNHLHR